MTADDPFRDLLTEALNLMHPRFAANGASGPAVARELYHQFRRLWDKALPVRLGLGHLLIQPDPAAADGSADLMVWQLGENGEPDRRLAAVGVGLLADPAGLDDRLLALARLRRDPGYPTVVLVAVGRAADVPAGGLPAAPGVDVLFFDSDRWAVAGAA